MLIDHRTVCEENTMEVQQAAVATAMEVETASVTAVCIMQL